MKTVPRKSMTSAGLSLHTVTGSPSAPPDLKQCLRLHRTHTRPSILLCLLLCPPNSHLKMDTTEAPARLPRGFPLNLSTQAVTFSQQQQGRILWLLLPPLTSSARRRKRDGEQETGHSDKAGGERVIQGAGIGGSLAGVLFIFFFFKRKLSVSGPGNRVKHKEVEGKVHAP